LPGQPTAPFVLTGDGEQQEGSNWEAAMVAGHRKLVNLTLIIDRNRLQQGAGTEETSGLDPLDDKYRAFGFDVHEVDGHDPAALLATLGAAPGNKRRVIANTVKGKGVSFMEGVAFWHHGVPNAAQHAQAMKELV
jgi:transketolase